MATSPNYSWPEPDNTDLVKNGALAIRTMGNAIDTTMATMTPKSTYTAKGSIAAATGASTPANLSVGNNGETLVADSSTSTGLRYTAGTVQANPVLNSAMQIWQRGTSVANPGNYTTYTADRWVGFRNTSATGLTVTRQVTNDTTNLPFIQYCARVQRDSGNTNTSYLGYVNSFEILNSVSFAGKTITLSYYARAGANFSPTSGALNATIYTGTGSTEVNRASTGYTGDASPLSATATLTTTWQRFTVTGNLASNITQMAVFFATGNCVGTAGANDYFEVTGVQIDIGSVALPFRTYAGTIQQELAACQRYYFRNAATSAQFSFFMSGFNTSTTALMGVYTLPVTMRIPPTLQTTGTASNYRTFSVSGSITLSTVPAIDTANEYTVSLTAGVTAGLVAGQGVVLLANGSTAAYLGFTAEL
jgi:hypothetical protein